MLTDIDIQTILIGLFPDRLRILKKPFDQNLNKLSKLDSRHTTDPLANRLSDFSIRHVIRFYET
ncbi:MAG: hypothetical protein EOP52_00585 [Sphingobacteriales bacterium]|nr:MAG: hypothetical protein EOP52_00585 [Sphingobacteriales bacterium]